MSRSQIFSSLSYLLKIGYLVIIFATSFYSYLLFHIIAEIFSIVIAFLIFVIVWNARKSIENYFLYFIGISFLFIGIFDLLHTLSYSGMNIFIEFDTNLPTQLWIVARLYQSVTLFTALIFSNRKMRNWLLLPAQFGISLILLVSIFYWQNFPVCYIEGEGLTPFKIYCEYLISIILFISIIFLSQKKKPESHIVKRFLYFALIFSILSELLFTFYVDVYDISNLFGHLFKIIAFYFIYRAMIETSFKEPINSLYADLKNREEQLELMNQKLLLFVNNIPEAILILEPTGQIILQNEQCLNFCKMFLKKNNQKINSIYDIIETNQLTNTIQSILQNKIEKSIKVEVLPNEFWLQVQSKLLFSPVNKNLIAVIFVMNNITPFIEFDNLRKRFLSMVSHELRTPITSIDLSINNFRKYKSKLSEEQKEKMLDIMARSSALMIEMIEDLLIISRVESGNINLSIKENDITGMFEELFPQLEDKRLYKEIKFIPNIEPNLKLICDRKRMKQVFRILLNNALKYSPEKSVVEVRAQKFENFIIKSKNSTGILIQVEDHGIGIKKEDLSNLFTPFFRSDEVKAIEGTGLGLSIAKEFVEMHGGQLFVDSEYGKGSCFSIFIPEMQVK